MTVALRPLRPGDVPALVDVFVQAFRHGYPEVLPADVLDTVTPGTVSGWFAHWTATLNTTVAEVDGVPVGFVRYGDQRQGRDQGPGRDQSPGEGPGEGQREGHGEGEEPEPPVGYVAALYVHPDASGAGIGRLLLDHAMDSLTESGRVAVTLWVFRANERARGLYRRAGFVPDGTEMVDPQWRVPQIRMRRPLPR